MGWLDDTIPTLALASYNTSLALGSNINRKKGEERLMITYIAISNIYVHAAAAAKSLQSCLTLCDPIDGLLPGSSLSGILQARTLEWVAISFSNV